MTVPFLITRSYGMRSPPRVVVAVMLPQARAGGALQRGEADGAGESTDRAWRTMTKRPGWTSASGTGCQTVPVGTLKTRPSVSVIVPATGFTEATVPATSARSGGTLLGGALRGGALVVGGGGAGDAAGDGAVPSTWMLFTRPFTPLTALAICAARARRSGVSTMPLSVTM